MDKKSQHVGNHGGRYTDINGASRQFTYVDHDKKIKMGGTITKEEISQAKEDLKSYKVSLIERLLNLPPSACPDIFQDYVQRDGSSILWNEKMIRDEGVPLNTLQSICVLIENKITP